MHEVVYGGFYDELVKLLVLPHKRLQVQCLIGSPQCDSNPFHINQVNALPVVVFYCRYSPPPPSTGKVDRVRYMCTVVSIDCHVDPVLVVELSNIYAPLYETKSRHAWSNFNLLILYFDVFVDIQFIGSSMNAYPAEQS